MNQQPFTKLRFDRRWQVHISGRGMWLCAVVGAYLLAWLAIPPTVLFWIGLPLFGGLAWVASFSWREALQAIDRLIHRLDNL